MSLVDRASVLFAHAYERAFRRFDAPASHTPTAFIGHRGTKGHRTIPENSLEAFDFAIERGAGLETDLRRTADDHVVLHHDPTLPGSAREIRTLTLAEVQRLAPEVPTLEQLFARTADRCPRYWLEVKGDDSDERLEAVVRDALAAARTHGIEGRIGFLALDARTLRIVRRMAPDVPRMYVYLVSPKAGMDYLEEDPQAGLAGWFFTFPTARLARYRAERRPTGVGFVEHRRTAAFFAKLGFDYLFSDSLAPLRAHAEAATAVSA